jgi:hypothetical protein
LVNFADPLSRNHDGNVARRRHDVRDSLAHTHGQKAEERVSSPLSLAFPLLPFAERCGALVRPPCSYLQFSSIAARLMRNALKEDAKKVALRRSGGGINIKFFENGQVTSQSTPALQA